MKEKTLIALDLDNTLTAGKSPLEEENRHILDRLCEKYRLVIVGAGYHERIISQLDSYPVDVIGNYGMQIARYSKEDSTHLLVRNDVHSVDRVSVCERADKVFEHFSLNKADGDRVQFYPSGCFTLALLGTTACYSDKKEFDPTKRLRREMHPFVSGLFPEYTVFIGGNSSLDMAPLGYSKYKALCDYCNEMGITHDEVVFCGDDYGKYGNDESVYNSDFDFIKIDNYRNLGKKLSYLL